MSKTRMMYLHTLDGKPAICSTFNGEPYMCYAGNGCRSRAAKFVPSLRQIRREQQACIAAEWKFWNARNPEYRGERPSIKRYDYVLVAVAQPNREAER